MKAFICCLQVFVLLLVPNLGQAADADIPVTENQGCMEGPMAQFGQYIGNWTIEDWRLSQDGSEWLAGTGAKWNFICVGNGAAIQDFWMPNDGEVGTNLRIWNETTASWEIAWTVTSTDGLTIIGAKQDEAGNIVMHYKTPIPDPPRRITFFPEPKTTGTGSSNFRLTVARPGPRSTASGPADTNRGQNPF